MNTLDLVIYLILGVLAGVYVVCVAIMFGVIIRCRVPDLILSKKDSKPTSMLMDDNY